ncbi:D-inositol-3-phosphate glycosyltransferase [Brevundimonas subvibrioides]|uniref:glycosyltransferase family 4 protein n=1 Tax=Brevundimonas subvibrioides TaxID=74313 RepID=UPI0032D57B7D
MSGGGPTGVLIVTCEYPPFPGGIGSYAGAVARATADAGFAVRVIAPDYPDLPAIDDLPGTHRILRHHGVPPKRALAILKIISETPRDWPILAADIRTVLFLWATQAIHRRSYRAMIHGSEVSKFGGGGVMAAVVRRAYRGAEAICSNSQATLDIFTETLGTPAAARVTYLAVDPFWAQPAEGPFEHPALAALAPDQVIACAVGRIEPRKGHVETIRALALARDKWAVLLPLFVVAGRPEHPDHLARVIAEAEALGVPLLAAGRLSDQDLRRLYARARFHTLFAQALPGKIEGFGLVLLEAAAQGCPSIATALGGIPEVLGSAGTLVAPGDGVAFAEAIAEALAAERTPQSDRVMKQRTAEFSWERCARQTFPELTWP